MRKIKPRDTRVKVQHGVFCDVCRELVIDRLHIISRENNSSFEEKNVCGICAKKLEWNHDCSWHGTAWQTNSSK